MGRHLGADADGNAGVRGAGRCSAGAARRSRQNRRACASSRPTRPIRRTMTGSSMPAGETQSRKNYRFRSPPGCCGIGQADAAGAHRPGADRERAGRLVVRDPAGSRPWRASGRLLRPDRRPAGATPCACWRSRRSMSALIEEIVGEPAGFAAMPRLAMTPCASRSIDVGDAAVALDPLSGNGVGSGLRSAILAAAVLEAAERDAMPQACFDHYAQRLRKTMRSHVQSCVEFYGQAAHAAGWRAEIGMMVEALHRLPTEPESGGVHAQRRSPRAHARSDRIGRNCGRHCAGRVGLSRQIIARVPLALLLMRRADIRETP